jgi:hypothetical protein
MQKSKNIVSKATAATAATATSADNIAKFNRFDIDNRYLFDEHNNNIEHYKLIVLHNVLKFLQNKYQIFTPLSVKMNKTNTSIYKYIEVFNDIVVRMRTFENNKINCSISLVCGLMEGISNDIRNNIQYVCNGFWSEFSQSIKRDIKAMVDHLAYLDNTSKYRKYKNNNIIKNIDKYFAELSEANIAAAIDNYNSNSNNNNNDKTNEISFWGDNDDNDDENLLGDVLGDVLAIDEDIDAALTISPLTTFIELPADNYDSSSPALINDRDNDRTEILEKQNTIDEFEDFEEYDDIDGKFNDGIEYMSDNDNVYEEQIIYATTVSTEHDF